MAKDERKYDKERYVPTYGHLRGVICHDRKAENKSTQRLFGQEFISVFSRLYDSLCT
jgi:hypothetical protein